MKQPLVRIEMDDAHFGEQIKNFSAASGRSIELAFRDGCRFVAAELVKRTPPFGGKTLNRMLNARGKAPLSDPEMSAETPRKIGEKAVMRDMAKLFIKVKNWWGAKAGPRFAYLFSASGKHYGTELSRWNPSPSRDWAEQIRARFRSRKGRVSYNIRPTESAEWVNTKRYPLPELTYELLEKQLLNRVGEARGGWAASYAALGGRVAKGSWVGRHIRKGECKVNFNGDNLSVEMINKSAWASGGDQDRVRQGALQGASEYIAKEVKRRLASHWGNKSGRAGVID